jgi:choline dehydrogenase-like flavoprotein
MSRKEKDQWTRAELDSIKGGVSASAKGVQLKRIFGSDFPFKEANELLPRKASGVGHLTPSLAVGGFSNVWGAAALPFSTRDLQGWPISSEDLDPFYRSVTRFMPLTGAEDDLRELFPIRKTTN